ncbi:molybdopterin molybdotransferase MoeA [Jatrophihabitans sp.]|uniref:molybdopterin molybdotransferase MoeA n=1 Tax=Jatrophihabitans sp. TaxID=1932789 RepID=UPI002C9EA76A|nr:molybdopterin molybdotransferase MoeA [Jatrophihabitans sp.]
MTADSRQPSPQDAYARWVAACAGAGWHPEPAIEQVPVQAGLGRVTALAVHARRASPRFACAAMDGIALAWSSLGADAGVPAPAFSWVDTGDSLPAGTDTVVERERVAVCADGSALVTGAVTRGRNVRAVGEDFPAGRLLVSGGHRLRPADLGAAATAGYVTLAVARRPAVAIIPTGDEIRPVGSALGPGEFTDSNSVMLAALAARCGALPTVTDVQPDDPERLAAAVRQASSTADLVLVLAGSSRGRDDHTATVLAQVGGVAVHGVAVRPGHPVLLGHVRTGRPGADSPGSAGRSAMAVPAIGVPGYPLAAAVIFELFAAPLLQKLEGQRTADREPVQARLGCDWNSPPGVEDWVPVSLDAGPDSPVAVPSAGHGAGSLSRLVRADAWWPIPIGQGPFARGDRIEVLPVGI